MARSFWLCALMPLVWVAGCIGSDPVLGILPPDAVNSRHLSLRNASHGYVVFRVTVPGFEPWLSPLMPPGAEQHLELGNRFGTLCPESLNVEIAAYRRARSELSPLQDETLESQPCAANGVTLVALQHYGCNADPSWVSLDSTINCNVLEVDEAGGAIGFQFGWLPPQRQPGVQLDDPPRPTPAEMFPLKGRVVNMNNQPLAGVEVQLPQLNASVLTDAAGRFSVLRPAGVYLVEPLLGDVEISPAFRRFTHFSPEEVPIEFIALTQAIPTGVDAGEPK